MNRPALNRSAVCVSSLALMALAGSALGQASLTVIHPPAGQRDVNPYGISADGLHVTGFTYQPSTQPYFSCFRWTSGTGVQFVPGLTALAGGTGYALSANGSVIVGESDGRAFRWSAANGIEGLAPVLSGAYDVSADGTVVVGRWDENGFRKDGASPIVTLAPSAGFTSAEARAVSADGATAVGQSFRNGLGYGAPGEVFYQPTRWVGSGAPQAIPTQPEPWQNGYALDVSADGSVTVGTLVHQSQGETRAFRNTAQGTAIIPSVCDGSMMAVAVSADGSVVTGDSVCGPWVWDATHGTRLVQPLLAAAGVDFGSLFLSFSRGISADGMTIVGEGNLGITFAPVGYVVHLPGDNTNCTADFNGDGDIGTDADIEAFFACLAGNCCATCGTADFNNDGDIGTDADIESFFRVLAGGNC